MKRNHLKNSSIICLLVLLLLPMLNVQAQAKQVLPIQHWRTSSHTRVLFVQTKGLPMVDIAVTFAAGSAFDGKQYGLAYFTKSMLDEGSKHLTAQQIALRFDEVGAHFSTSADRDMTTIMLRTLTKPAALQQALTTFYTVISAPTFPQKNFLRLKNQLLLLLKREQQLPGKIAGIAFFKRLYGRNPYGHPIKGTIKTVSAITPQDLQAFYRRFYVAQNALIVIVGDVTHKQAEQIANTISTKLPSGKKARLPSESLLAVKSDNKQLTVNFPSQQTHIYLGELGISRHNKGYLALRVANYILGGGPMVSRLFKTIREQQGLVYDVSSHFYSWQKRGPFLIVMQTRTQEAQKALKLTQKTLMDFVKNGVSKKELHEAKQYYLGSFPLYFASNSGIVVNLINIGFYHLPLDYLDTYRARLTALTLKQVNQAIRNTIQLNRLQVVMVGTFKQ